MDYVDVDQMYEDTVCCACEQADYEMALKYGYDEDIEFDGEEEDVEFDGEEEDYVD